MNKIIKMKEPQYIQIAEWLMKRVEEILPAQKIGFKILEVTGQDSIKKHQFSQWITKCRFYLENKYGYTIFWANKDSGYKVVKKGSFEASEFTMRHYRRAVLNAARAQELNDLGFLNPQHIPHLIEEVMGKASRKTKELASLKMMLLQKYKELRSQERRTITHGNL